MQVTITGTPKEIAALALELQERRALEGLADDLINRLQTAAIQSESAFQP